MSYSNNRPFRGRGGGRGRNGGYQQRFVPKSSLAVSSSPTTTSTSSSGFGERQKCGPNHPLAEARLSAPLRRNSSVPQSSSFVRYLPQDEAVASGLGADSGGLDTVESQAVVDLLNDELSSLLRLKPRDFWREVASNDSLHEALDSYLLFKNRWYDLPHRGGKDGLVAGIIVGDAELCRRVFMTYYRMSSNGDPGAPANDCLSVKEHTALIQDKKLLDLPKLLDICAIYGRDNEELTRSLVNNAIIAQPRLVGSLPDACHRFLEIASTMHQRCISSLERLVNSTDRGAKEPNRLYCELMEVVDFINDSVVTLDAFVNAYRPASFFFSFPTNTSENLELLGTLAKLHDSLFPALHEAFALFSGNPNSTGFCNGMTRENVELSLKILSSRITKFGYRILEICYLSDEFHGDANLDSCRKIFPSQISDPAIRGDILLQTFRDVGHHLTHLQGKIWTWGSFLQIIEKNYYILSLIDSLRSNGWIFMDEEQFHSLTQTIASSLDSADEVQKGWISSQSNRVEINEDDIILESKISQIRDIFPDYGKGFLAACLDVYDQNPEVVIQRILEGTLHADLLSMDISLDNVPGSKISSNTKDKGKGILIEPVPDIKDKGKGILIEPVPDIKDKGKGLLYVQHPHAVGWSSTAGPAGEGDGAGSVGEGDGKEPFLQTSGRFTRKSNNERPDSEVLDSKSVKDILKSSVLAAAEYEDEYDDSFDDLGLSIVESGTEEIDESRDSSSSEFQKNDSLWNSKKKTQFYVKDGKNYSYKISGSVAVSDAREAAALVQSQKGLIHGLGRGGNIPSGVTRRLVGKEGVYEEPEEATSGGRGTEYSSSQDGGSRLSGNYPGRGRGGNFRIVSGKPDSDTQVNADTVAYNNRDQHRFQHNRGSGRGGNHHRKDRAMKKHFSGLTGY